MLGKGAGSAENGEESIKPNQLAGAKKKRRGYNARIGTVVLKRHSRINNLGGWCMNKGLRKKVRQMLATFLIAALLICNMAVPAFAEEAVASAFRLSQTAGTVKVQNQNGKEITTMQDMKLFNGYQIDTAQQSYAWFEADSTKMFKMDAVSNLEVRKKGKQLELLLNSGNLFFNVTEHLQDDEVLNIRTSSMVVGIRGTSGWVKVIDQFHTILYMLDGSVEASVTDPVSGQRKSITLHGGQRADFWIYDKNKQGDKCDIIVQQYGEEEIDGFVAVELKKSEDLQNRVRAAIPSGYVSGFDLDRVIAQAEERLKKDQAEVAEKLAEIEKKIAELASRVDVDPVFTNNTTKEDSKSESSQASTSTDITPEETIDDPTTLTMPVEDDVVNDYLNNKNVSVILQPSSNASDNVLTVDSGLTVPSGKSLTIGTGISTNVQNGQTMQVDGHMEQEGDLSNAGTVNNTSTNTLQVGGSLTNTGTLNNETGRLIVKGILKNSGSLTNGNIIENTNTMENTGTFTVTGGNVGAVTLSGGTLTVKGGTITSVAEQGGKLSMDGGTVTTVITTQDSMDLNDGEVDTVTIDGGSFKAAGGDAKNIILKSGTFTVENGGTTGDITVEGGNLTVSGGTTGAITVSGGTFSLSGGTTGAVTVGGGSFTMNGGITEDVTMSGGTFATSGGSTGTVTMSDGTFTVDGGSTGTITVNNGTFTVNSGSTGAVTMNAGTMTTKDGTIKAVELTGGTLKLEGGTTDKLTLTDGTVTISADGALGHAEINGGEFILDGGTVTDGISQNAEADVTLTSGSIEAGDADAALAIAAGLLNLNMDHVTVTADTSTALLTVEGKGEVQIHSSLFEAEPNPFDTGAVVLCKPNSVLTYEGEGQFQEMQGPYTLNGIWGNLEDALSYMNEEDEVIVLSEDSTLKGGNNNGYSLANATYVIELNGNNLELVDKVNFSIGNNGDAEKTPTRFVFHDESGKGTVKVDTGLEINQYAAVLFENLNLEFGESGLLMPGYAGCAAISFDRVKITDSGNVDVYMSVISPEKGGSAGIVKVKDVQYQNMTRPFCTETTSLLLEDSTFTGEDVQLFEYGAIVAPEITYTGNVLLGMDAGPFPYDGILADKLLPTKDQCSTVVGQDVVIRMKNYAPGFDTFLEEAGYTLKAGDDGYQYIMPSSTTSLTLIDGLATPSDLIPVVDEDLATPSDASAADEILDMDYIIWDEELATASNASRAEDEILDEDFFWLEEDWDEEEDATSQKAVTEEVLLPEDSITLENRLTEEANEAADAKQTADTETAENKEKSKEETKEETKTETKTETKNTEPAAENIKPEKQEDENDASKEQSADAVQREEEES